ncbi:MAG: Mur ligase family protein [Gammaproteobacteria bacterium]|nr:Mur ligase family protein [Gammaproteobacteria bacterium]
MGSSDLHSWLAWIELAQQTGRKRSWYHVVRVARQLGVLKPARQVVVIAGTNGKGTTVNFTEQLLLAQGIKVGSTYSPHLERYNERIRVNGREVGDEEIVFAFEVIQEAQDNVQLSYHDYATLAGLWIFKEHGVDVALLEVGVGGRYDATNVVHRDVNVITSIALDHQEMLGPDLETIGWEKAGISRCGIPILYGDTKNIPTVMGRARALDCPVYRRGCDFDYRLFGQNMCSIAVRQDSSVRRLKLSGIPEHPLSLALAAQITVTLGYPISDSVISESRISQLPGRMELFHHLDRVWLLDVAHNPDAVEYLMRFLPKLTDKRVVRVLLGISKRKDFSGIVNALKIPTDRVLVTSTQGRRGTTWKAQSADFGIQCIEELDFAYQELVANTVSGDLILVVGSFDVVGRLRAKVAS